MYFLLILAFTFKVEALRLLLSFCVCVICDKYFQNLFIFDSCMHNSNILIITNDSSKMVLINISRKRRERSIKVKYLCMI